MKNRNANYVSYRLPTSAELYAYEREARRLRDAEMSRLAKAAATALRSFVTVRAKEMKHA